MRKTTTVAGGILAAISGTAIAVVATGGMAMAAPSAVTLTATPTTAKSGQAVTLHATGGDNAAQYGRLCIERLNKQNKWHKVQCANADKSSANVSVSYKVVRRGTQQFRAELFTTNQNHRHLSTNRTSNVVNVTVN